MFPAGQRKDVALLALDTKFGKSTINFGVGGGTNNASPRLLVKMVVALEFD
jgi:hypothetical protein